MRHIPHARLRPPGGFTLVELLVVLGIIAILASLSAAAVIRFIGVQQKKNTEQLVQKLTSAFNQQWLAARDHAKDTFLPGSNDPNIQGVLALAGGDVERARVIWRHLYLRREFPTSYAEARAALVSQHPQGLWNIAIQPNPTFFRVIGNRGGPTPTSAEASACLLLVLTQGRRGMAAFEPDAQLGPQALQDTDGDGLKEIVDNWGIPVGFWRFPVLNSDPDVVGKPNALDPEGKLTSPAWNNAPNYFAVREFERLTGFIVHEDDGQTPPQSWQVRVFQGAPVIASAGPDEKWGVQWGTMALLVPNDATDNLYSFRLNLGASGN
jgi:prepilin-type N-terminal cleavage/methylation domain-containing protein